MIDDTLRDFGLAAWACVLASLIIYALVVGEAIRMAAEKRERMIAAFRAWLER